MIFHVKILSWFSGTHENVLRDKPSVHVNMFTYEWLNREVQNTEIFGLQLLVRFCHANENRGMQVTIHNSKLTQ